MGFFGQALDLRLPLACLDQYRYLYATSQSRAAGHPVQSPNSAVVLTGRCTAVKFTWIPKRKRGTAAIGAKMDGRCGTRSLAKLFNIRR